MKTVFAILSRRDAGRICLISLMLLHLGRAAAFALVNKMPTNTNVLPLIVQGSAVPSLLGASVIKLSAFSCRSGSIQPILFQLDEVNADDRVVPSEASAAITRDDEPGVVDSNDQILFMMKDLGDACPADQLAKARGKLTEIQVTASYLETPGVIYVLVSDRGYVPSNPLVRYDPATQTVITSSYTHGYLESPPFLYNRISYADMQGRSNEDLLDRVKVRFFIKAVGSLVRLTMTEEDVKSTLDGTRVGPLRVSRELTASIEPLPGFAVKTLVTYEHYERLWRARVKFLMPKPAAMFLNSMDVSFIHDFIDLRGIRLSTSGLPQGTLIDGKMIEQERNLTLTDQPWFMISGSGINQVTTVEYDSALKLEPTAIFIDSEAEADPPEEAPGGLPAVGFQLKNWEGLKAQWYNFGASIAPLKSFPEGGGNGFYKALHEEVGITSRALE